MKVRSLPCLLLAGVLLTAGYANPQNLSTSPDTKTPGKKHPKLGLVLEGGGALGLAHIGVITWMEEHHIPVSYVAGTSMGGLVGGVYATGRSPAEVKGVVETIDWDEVLRVRHRSRTLPFGARRMLAIFPLHCNLACAMGYSFRPASIPVNRSR